MIIIASKHLGHFHCHFVAQKKIEPSGCISLINDKGGLTLRITEEFTQHNQP